MIRRILAGLFLDLCRKSVNRINYLAGLIIRKRFQLSEHFSEKRNRQLSDHSHFTRQALLLDLCDYSPGPKADRFARTKQNESRSLVNGQRSIYRNQLRRIR